MYSNYVIKMQSEENAWGLTCQLSDGGDTTRTPAQSVIAASCDNGKHLQIWWWMTGRGLTGGVLLGIIG